jgi:ankyrin repeat protein
MLWEATRYGQEKVVLWLLEKGIDVNAFPWRIRNTNHSALQIAASLGNLSMVRLLLNRGADVNLNGLNTTGHPSIEGAARCGQEAIVELLIVHGADPRKALLSATAGGQPRLIRLLLNRLPDLPNRKSGDVGRMALLKAFACRNLRAITMLVEAGVSLNLGLEPSLKLLNLAKEDGLPWMVAHLLSLGAEETDKVVARYEQGFNSRAILVSERTWDWVGKY